jgi:UDP-glucuronate 4-epimerase
MKILFTGHTSFAGRRLHALLVEQGHHVVGTSRRPASGSIVLDLSSESATDSLPDERFDVLVHFAAHVPHNERESGWPECAPVNVQGTDRLLRWARTRVSRILLASSTAIYGDEKIYTPTDEDHPLRPDSGYSLSKFAMETLVQAFCKLHHMPYAAMRIGYVYGGGLAPTRALMKFVKQVETGAPITLQDPTLIGLPLIHLDDIARIGARLVYEGYGPYNLASPRHISLAQFVEALFQVMGRKTEVKSVVSGRLNSPTHWYSLRRLAQRHGIAPSVTLEAGIASLLEGANGQ